LLVLVAGAGCWCWCWLLVLVAGCWLLVAGAGCWLLVAGCWLLVLLWIFNLAKVFKSTKTKKNSTNGFQKKFHETKRQKKSPNCVRGFKGANNK
jgi:hypothetical protein